MFRRCSVQYPPNRVEIDLISVDTSTGGQGALLCCVQRFCVLPVSVPPLDTRFCVLHWRSFQIFAQDRIHHSTYPQYRQTSFQCWRALEAFDVCSVDAYHAFDFGGKYCSPHEGYSRRWCELFTGMKNYLTVKVLLLLASVIFTRFSLPLQCFITFTLSDDPARARSLNSISF